MSIKNTIKEQALKQILTRLHNVSDENIMRLLTLGEKLSSKTEAEAIGQLKELFKQGHPGLQLAKKILGSASPKCREKLVTNFLINYMLKTQDRRKEFFKENEFMPPWFLLISPTMKCNLTCVGCSTREYSSHEDLTFEELDKVLTEAKEMGIYFIVTLGGEIYTRPDMLKIFEKHNDMYFLTYTNGTLFKEDLVKKLSELGNVSPAFSVEGFEKETDCRRGEGVFKKVLSAMELCKKHGVVFGISTTATSENSDLITSDKFIDFFMDKGAYYSWFFQYIPIGMDPDVSLMPTPEQRVKLRQRTLEIRDTKPFFIGDFWNDGPYVSGCLAGGRNYLHITHNGLVEPCGFVHFAVDNIREKSLKEVLTSDFFKKIRANQQKIDNLLLPCMIIDHPEFLRQAVKECGAKPTHPGAETIIENPKITNFLDNYSKKIKELSDPEWKNSERYKIWREQWEETRKREY